MAVKKRDWKIEVIPLADLAKTKKAEAKKMSFAEKIEWTTKLREFAYGPKATTGRIQRIYSIVKLSES